MTTTTSEHLDGYCDAGCGAPAVVCITIDGEDGFFCASCAPTGPARPVEPSAGIGLYGKPCPCGGRLEWLGEDRNGRDFWLCRSCDHRE
jgi:hypothetical protein